MSNLGEVPEVLALEQRLRQRERQLNAVVSVTRTLQTRVKLDELMHHALLAAMDTMDADAGSLLQHDTERHLLVFRAVEGPSKAKITGMEIADTQGIAGEVFHSGQARISQDVRLERAHILDVDRTAEYQTLSMITIPLIADQGEVIGVLQVLNKRTGPFDEEDLSVAQVLATQVAAAIANAQLHERAQAAALVDMLGHITHDIKNLLTPVSMAGQTLRMMLADCYDQLSAMRALGTEDMAKIEQLLRGLQVMLGTDIGEIIDILDESTSIAQQRAKEIADAVKGMTTPAIFEMADLNDVVRGVTRVLALVADQQKVTLSSEFAELPPAPLDTKRIYNAIYNLINNAIGATGAGGQVTIRTGVCPDGTFPEGSFVQFQVVDTGCGMLPEVAARLFTGHVRSTKPGGTGLGTRVVKNVIEAHDGSIGVTSIPDTGTTITVKLPIMRNA
ncbi:MAG: ATP-binding protein [Armatimonadota bacterium]